MKKKNSIRPFLAHPAGGQETTFYLTVAPGDRPRGLGGLCQYPMDRVLNEFDSAVRSGDLGYVI